MLNNMRYKGPIILRDDAVPKRREVVPGHYPRKAYPKWRDRWGNPLRQAPVEIEQELAEIRARHEARREYNRIRTAARRAREALEKATRNATADHRALDKSDAG